MSQNPLAALLAAAHSGIVHLNLNPSFNLRHRLRRVAATLLLETH